MENQEVEETTINSLDSLEEYFSNKDNSQNVFYMSDVPEVCKEYPCILGIDEAGRGPVLGPMVYGTAYCPINEQMILHKLQCADSKSLTEDTRDVIFKNILDSSKTVGWAIEAISPNVISNNMLGRSKYSLNQMSMEAAIKLIRSVVESGVKVEHIFVDTVGKPEPYQKYLESIFPSCKIVVAKKADSTYPIVSAASICAKVSRDHFLKTWQFQEGFETSPEKIGSGYPNDPVTKKYLLENCDPIFGFPHLVRFSWSTAENVLKNLAYGMELPDNEEDGSKKKAKGNKSITSFFKPEENDETVKPRKEHLFFTQRSLCRRVEF